MLKLSLIIPVYNEERHIKACLDAVASQSVMPDEVIVVDNNCTDNTIKIAKSYNFVRVITEKKQGRAYARSAGFNSAKHDILGRIDADSVVSENWAETVVNSFNNDNSLYGLTGLAYSEVVPYFAKCKSKILSRAYYWYVHAGFNTITMWGANMALRANAWDKVKDDVILDDKKVHEDQDLSLWMAGLGLKISQNNLMIMTTSGRTYRYLPKYLHYYSLYKRTKKLHRGNGNLKSPDLIRIGFFMTLPGRIFTVFASIHMLLMGIIFYPIDSYNIQRGKMD